MLKSSIFALGVTPPPDMRKALPRDTKRETVRESSKGLKVFVEQQ